MANGWADYALLGGNARPVVYVESKALSVTKPAVLQTVSYAVTENTRNTLKVNYCAWTNGDEWVVFDVFKQDEVIQVSLEREDSAKCALKLLGLWRRSLLDGSLDMPVEPLIDPKPPLPVVPEDAQWIPLTAQIAATGNPPPKAIRLPDGRESALKSWRGILLETALWLHDQKLLTTDNCRTHMGPVRLIFSPDGKHGTGTRFHSAISVGNTGIQMEGSVEPDAFVFNTRKVLNLFGKDPATIHLRMAN